MTARPIAAIVLETTIAGADAQSLRPSRISMTAAVTWSVVAVPPRSREEVTAGRGIPLDRLHQTACRALLAEMVQHHHRRPERAERIGDTLAHDVEGRAVDRFEHRRKLPLRIEVGGRRNAEGTGQRSSKIAENVSVKIGGNNDIQRTWVEGPCVSSLRRPASCRF